MSKYSIKITKSRTTKVDKVDFNDIPFGKVFSDHMFTADYVNGKWKKFKIQPYKRLSFHPTLLALHYGQSIFEGMKASKTIAGKALLFRPEMHAHRLNISAERMCMPTFPEDIFVAALKQLVALDNEWIPTQEGSALYIRPLMFATDELLGVKPSATYKLVIFTGPVGPYYPKPLKVWVEEKFVRAVHGGAGFAKAAGNYGGVLLPTKKANEKGYDQVIWLDAFEHKYIQESGTMNLVFVIDGKVVTPAIEDTILNGVTRDSLLRLWRDKGYTIEERPISIDEILDAHQKGLLQEAFGVGTAAIVAQISEIGFRDQVLKLPPVEGRQISNYGKNTINAMRAGKIQDPYNWLVEAPVVLEMAHV